MSEQWKPKYNPWAIAMTVTLATFMEVLDTSIANVALPHIAGSLSAGQDESTWVLTSYLVSNAVVLPISAWLATRFGRKRFYMLCVALFGISSFLCGVAPALGLLIFFRILQGAGGGGLAPTVGPTLGGFITDNFSWRWIFFINIPVAIVSLVLTSRMVEDPPYLASERAKAGPVDYIGLGLIGLGLGSLQVMLDKGEREDWLSSHLIVAFLALTAIGLVGAVVWEIYQRDPIIEVHLFKNRTFAISFVMMFMLGFSVYGTTVLIPQLLQTFMGYTAELAGKVLSPGGFVIMLLMPVIGVLVSKLDPRRLVAFGFFISAVALYHMTTMNLDMDFAAAVRLRIYQSIGMAFLFVPINTLSYTDVPRKQNNSVSGLMNLARNVGGSVGISTVTSLLARRAQYHQTVLASHTTNLDHPFRSAVTGLSSTLASAGTSAADATGQAYAQLYGAMQRQAGVLAYIDAVVIFAAVTLLMVPLAFLMRKPKPGAAAAMH